MTRPHRKLACTALALVALLGLSGCARTLPTAPVQDVASARDTAPPPPSRLAAPSLGGTVVNLVTWYPVCQKLVLPDAHTLMRGSRYELTFPRGAVSKLELISIQEYDPDVLDVQLGPHGIKFGEPVVLSIDFTGTRADPGAAVYDQSEPVLYWLNEATNRWEEVPGRTDWDTRRHIVRLEHFSRYVLGGKAGWKETRPREGE